MRLHSWLSKGTFKVLWSRAASCFWDASLKRRWDGVSNSQSNLSKRTSPMGRLALPQISRSKPDKSGATEIDGKMRPGRLDCHPRKNSSWKPSVNTSILLKRRVGGRCGLLTPITTVFGKRSGV